MKNLVFNTQHSVNSKLLFLVAFLFSISLFSQGYQIPEKPKFIPALVDSIGLLEKAQFDKLSRKLQVYSDSTSTEIFVAIISTTKGEDIAYLATNWGHKWGIGQKGKDNGVFLLVAKDDRKVTIQSGYGTEHVLTDFMSRRIIQREITPSFKRGNFYEGLDKGTDGIFKVLNGEYKREKKQNIQEFNPGSFIFIIIIIIVFILISRGNKNNRRNFRECIFWYTRKHIFA